MKFFKIILFVLTLSMISLAFSQDDFDEFSENVSGANNTSSPLNLEGFLLFEQGINISRVGPQKENGRDFVLANRKLRLQSTKSIDQATLNFKLDIFNDQVAKSSSINIREAKVDIPLSNWLDLSFGRQISTWGVGDFIFINDLFPKDWIAHFSGLDMEYVKNPADSLRLTSYFGNSNFDIVYTPSFSPDNTPTGCRFSIFDPNTSKLIANSSTCSKTTSNGHDGGKFEDGEIAASFKTKIGNQELALYGYHGFYKSPKGLKLSGGTLSGFYPKLDVYGLSSEGQIGVGILSFEFGYYNSIEDKNGMNALIENSKLKYLLGYRMDLSSNFSVGTQFYQEKMLDYVAYKSALSTPLIYSKKEYENTYTLRLTYKAQQETLWLSLFTYIRPEAHDSFTKLEIKKNISSNFQVATGVNIFTGDNNYLSSEFGMLKNDDNAFLRFKLNF